MIFPADWPLQPTRDRLRVLYVALNSPVVRSEPLPVGPASAAIAVHEGSSGVSLAIRSVRTGQVAFFTSDPDEPPTLAQGLDAALSFAEGLGFLFDENEVEPTGAGGEAAARLWCELIGEEYRGAAGAAPVSSPRPIRDDEVGIPVGTAGPAEVAPAPAPAVVGEPAAPDPSRTLSKFRWPAGPRVLAPAEERSS